jgi:CheY-like chemotaxis protein
MSIGARPKILVVDDDPVVRAAVAIVLEADFAVAEAASGEEALDYLAANAAALPELILLDIEMEQLDGYDTCRRLRAAGHRMPVIFVSSHDTLEERLGAYDAGGDDFVSKPFDAPILQRKVQLAAAAEERTLGLQETMYKALHKVGETGVLLEFLREAIRITDYDELAHVLLQAVGEYGLRCHVQLRYPDGAVTLTPSGAPSALEASILEQAIALGREFRFRRRLIINHDFVSLLVLDMPEDADYAARLTDYFNLLVESSEAVAETIEMRRESAGRAETLMTASAQSYSAVEELREAYRLQQADTRALLQELIETVEGTYVYLGLSENQEEAVSTTLREGAEKILKLFEQGVDFERKFEAVLDSLQYKRDNAADVWL